MLDTLSLSLETMWDRSRQQLQLHDSTCPTASVQALNSSSTYSAPATAARRGAEREIGAGGRGGARRGRYMLNI
jgi:hypothetical protein